MCVIVVKFSGFDIPNEKTLKKCWRSNDDGAGFAVQIGGKILIRKGFMRFEDLIENLEKLKKEVGEKELKKKNMIIHFRAASCVVVSPEYTHPFPVSEKIEDLMALEVKTKIAVAHNGVFFRMGTDTISDTQDFVRSVLAPLKRRIYEKNVLKLIERAIGNSKLAFLFASKDGRGRIELLGDFKEKDGYWFSNLNWEHEYRYYKWIKTQDYGGVWRYYVSYNKDWEE